MWAKYNDLSAVVGSHIRGAAFSAQMLTSTTIILCLFTKIITSLISHIRGYYIPYIRGCITSPAEM